MKKIRSQCPKGHVLDARNTYVRPNGARNCRLCRQAHRETYDKLHPSDDTRPCLCGMRYDEFRLGMSFAEARHMLWDQEDPKRPGWFRQKRRRSVLGFMREMKKHAFDMVHRYCEMEAAA